jgi:hypothetical protein
MRAGKTLPISVLAGAVLVPLSAVVSVMLVAPSKAQPTEPAAVASSPIAEAPPLSTDLAAACGPAGRELAAIDSGGSATETQRAALQALRPICAALGMALPEERVTAAVASVATAPDPVDVEAPITPNVEGPEVDYDDGEYELEYDDGEYEYEYDDGEWEFDD